METLVVGEVEAALMADALAFADAVGCLLTSSDSDSSPPEVFELGNGSAIMMGQGRFVNRLMGLTEVLSNAEFARLSEVSSAVSEPVCVELSPLAGPDVIEALETSGLTRSEATTVFVASRDELTGSPVASSGFEFEVVNDATVETWLKTAALGFGYKFGARRSAGDEFGLAAASLPEVTLYLIRVDGEPAATSSLTCRNGIAILGAMSTVESHRGRGIQSMSIAFRQREAWLRGCKMAISTASSGSTSSRNLQSNSMTEAYELIRYVGRPHV